MKDIDYKDHILELVLSDYIIKNAKKEIVSEFKCKNCSYIYYVNMFENNNYSLYDNYHSAFYMYQPVIINVITCAEQIIKDIIK